MKKVLSALALTASAMMVAPAVEAQDIYRAVSSGPGEATPNPSPGYSIATFEFDGTTMTATIPFTDLTTPTTDAHIHCCTTGAFTGTAPPAILLPGFPLGVMTGSYSRTFDLSDPAVYNPAFLAAFGGTASSASTALFGALADHTVYLNIHTSQYPGGEIRGFLVSADIAPIPEPATWGMLGAGLAGLAVLSRRRPMLLK